MTFNWTKILVFVKDQRIFSECLISCYSNLLVNCSLSADCSPFKLGHEKSDVVRDAASVGATNVSHLSSDNLRNFSFNGKSNFDEIAQKYSKCRGHLGKGSMPPPLNF